MSENSDSEEEVLSAGEDDLSLSPSNPSPTSVVQFEFSRWSTPVKDWCVKVLIKHLQFVTNDQSLAWGSKIQRAVCDNCGIPDDAAPAFWANSGQKCVTTALKQGKNRIRQAMKERFLGET
jgi:hypothetical protein